MGSREQTILPAQRDVAELRLTQVVGRRAREAATGDAAALERLLMRAQEVAWRFGVTVCEHADDAEDVTQR